MTSMQLDKEMIQDMVAQYGKEFAIEQLTSAAKAWIESLVEELEEVK